MADRNPTAFAPTVPREGPENPLSITQKKLALQTWTVREELRSNPEWVLKRVAELGFSRIELAGTAGMDPGKFAAICSCNGLTVVGVHVPPLTEANIEKHTDHILAQSTPFNSPCATVMLDPFADRDQKLYEAYASLCTKAGRILAQHGIQLAYHAYNYDVQPLERGRYHASGLDILMQNTSPDCLSVELDTYWLTRARVSLESLLDRYGPRCNHLHINDCDKEFNQKPLGKGIIQWLPLIVQIARQSTIKQLILEHDTTNAFAWLQDSLAFWTSVTK